MRYNWIICPWQPIDTRDIASIKMGLRNEFGFENVQITLIKDEDMEFDHSLLLLDEKDMAEVEQMMVNGEL